MKKVHASGKIDAKGHLKLDIPTSLHEGDVEVVLLIESKKKKKKTYDFSDITGKLQWKGDAVSVQRALRDEWE